MSASTVLTISALSPFDMQWWRAHHYIPISAKDGNGILEVHCHIFCTDGIHLECPRLGIAVEERVAREAKFNRQHIGLPRHDLVVTHNGWFHPRKHLDAQSAAGILHQRGHHPTHRLRADGLPVTVVVAYADMPMVLAIDPLHQLPESRAMHAIVTDSADGKRKVYHFMNDRVLPHFTGHIEARAETEPETVSMLQGFGRPRTTVRHRIGTCADQVLRSAERDGHTRQLAAKDLAVERVKTSLSEIQSNNHISERDYRPVDYKSMSNVGVRRGSTSSLSPSASFTAKPACRKASTLVSRASCGRLFSSLRWQSHT